MAKDADDGTITTATGVIGKVTGVETTENGFLLAVGAAKFDPKNIISVVQPES